MAQPTKYTRQYAFRAFQTANPDDPLPGQKVDLEYNTIKITLDQIIDNLALIQRDDGRLANNSVGTSQLDGALISLAFERPTTWATTTAYLVDDAVFQDNKLYVCLVDHNSGVFATDLAAAKWEELIDFTTIVTDAAAARDEAEGFAADAQAAKNSAETAAANAAGSANTWLGDTTGTNNYTLAANPFTPATREDGFKARFRVAIANTGAVNLNISTYGDADLKNSDGTELVSGDLGASTIHEASWNATLGYYVWDTGQKTGRLPAANTWAGINTFSAAVNFDAAVDFDGDIVIDGATDVNGALNVDGVAEFNAEVKVDLGLSMLSGPGGLPGGRLTLTSNTPVLTAETTAQTTVRYTPYLHNSIWLPDGTRWQQKFFTELSQTLADSTKSPAAAAVSSVYDMFVWNDSGTLRCTRGPAWSSSTSRGTGAGTTELERLNGVLVNKVAITNGPGANRGVYVGTIATNGTGANGELAMTFLPAAAAGGSNNRLDVWNMYNRVPVASTCRDSTDTWTYGTATWRAANGSNSNRITVIRGLDEDAVDAVYSVSGGAGGNATMRCAIGVDSTSARSGLPGVARINGLALGVAVLRSSYSGRVGIGQHYLQALEFVDVACTYYGDNAEPSDWQMGLDATMLC